MQNGQHVLADADDLTARALEQPEQGKPAALRLPGGRMMLLDLGNQRIEGRAHPLQADARAVKLQIAAQAVDHPGPGGIHPPDLRQIDMDAPGRRRAEAFDRLLENLAVLDRPRPGKHEEQVAVLLLRRDTRYLLSCLNRHACRGPVPFVLRPAARLPASPCMRGACGGRSGGPAPLPSLPSSTYTLAPMQASSRPPLLRAPAGVWPTRPEIPTVRSP